MPEIILCQSGVKRHGPELPQTLADRGHRVHQVECFDRCEVCERRLIARIDGATVALPGAAELLAALDEP